MNGEKLTQLENIACKYLEEILVTKKNQVSCVIISAIYKVFVNLQFFRPKDTAPEVLNLINSFSHKNIES